MKIGKKLLVFLITGFFITAWAAFKQGGPFAFAYKSIKKQSKTLGRGWSVDATGDGKTVLVGNPYFQTKIDNKKVIIGFAMLNENKSKEDLLLADFNMPSGSMMGASVAISPDGSVVATGGPGDKSNSPGHFSLFVKGKSGWKKPGKDDEYPTTMSFSGLENGWGLGMNVGLSSEGQTVVIAAPGDSGFGRVYYFVAPKGGWTNFKDVKSLDSGFLGITNASRGDEFGTGLAVSEDDSTIVVGAPGKDGEKGGVFLFRKPSGGWTKIEKLISVNIVEVKNKDRMGESVAVSKDGSVVVIGAPGTAGKSVGAVYVLTDIDYKKGTYKTYILPVNEEMKNHGISVAVSADGKTIAAGTFGKKNMGSVMIYTSKSGKWADGKNTVNISYTKETPSSLNALLGYSVDLTDDGKRVLIGAPLYNNGEGEYFWYDL